MLDTNKMPKDVALEYIEEKLNDETEIKKLNEEAIRDKKIIIEILKLCIESHSRLADQIVALVKEARKKES